METRASKFQQRTNPSPLFDVIYIILYYTYVHRNIETASIQYIEYTIAYVVYICVCIMYI